MARETFVFVTAPFCSLDRIGNLWSASDRNNANTPNEVAAQYY